MKTFISASVVVLLLLFNDSNLIAAQYDTGMIELKQPDETTFTGRIWGDEFFYWMETEEGYRFISTNKSKNITWLCMTKFQNALTQRILKDANFVIFYMSYLSS